MKSTINISISGVAFTLESDAYDTLSDYMKKVERAYKSDSAASEIISDIEARVSELVLSWQSEHATIVTKECIDAIIIQMGIPEETTCAQPTAEYAPDSEKQIVTRRLYRNAQGSRLGGVLNGFASYFDIDVTLLRILTVALFAACIFIGHHQGTTLPIIAISYIAMWMIIPVAKNARQKMEMHGQPITIETISSNIKEELNAISPNEKNEKTASIFTNLLYAIGRVIRFIFMFIAMIVGIVVFGIIISVIAVGCAIIFEGQDSIRLVIDTNPVWATILASICILVPLLLIMYTIIKMFLSLKWNNAILISLFSLWLVSWGVGAFTFASNVYDYSQRTSTEDTKRFNLQGNSLTITPSGSDYYQNHNFFDWKAGIVRDRVEFGIEENEHLSKSEIKIDVQRKSSGSTFNEAIENCKDIKFSYTLKNDTLTFPAILTYQAPESKYRGQEIRVSVEVAPGTNVVMPEHFYNRNRWRVFDNDGKYEVETSVTDNNVHIKSRNFQLKIDNNGVKIDAGDSKNGASINIDSTKVEVISIKNGKVVTTVK